ncbi:MAG: PIN domain-containing protein [Flavobacteriales bacterium]|nr:PIN domain-containing protein [Flavobacteriales bacterium]
MRLLLDTHTVIWFITNSTELPKGIKKLIENPLNECLLSHASLWEMAIKFSLGKLELRSELKEIFEIIKKSGIEILPINEQHLIKISELPFHHRDPFDRLIIAQALTEGILILSKDSQFKKYDAELRWQDR